MGEQLSNLSIWRPGDEFSTLNELEALLETRWSEYKAVILDMKVNPAPTPERSQLVKNILQNIEAVTTLIEAKIQLAHSVSRDAVE